MTDAATFNRAVHRLAPPPISSVQQWAKSYSGDRGPLVDLAQAVPGYPPHQDLLRWLADAAGRAENCGYGPIEGEPELRHAYARHVTELYGAGVGPSNIHITAGCNQAFVAAVMAIAEAGESVLLVTPFYFNHATSLEMLGIHPQLVKSRADAGFVPDPEAIEAAIHPGVRALALVTPNNPTGAVYPRETVQAIYDVCRRNGIWLLLDETYRDFLERAESSPHDLLVQTGWEDTVIQLYSFSKSFCIPGHRLGAITAGPDVIAEVAKIMDNLQICAPRVPQKAVARGLPALIEWRENNRREILDRARAFQSALAPLSEWEICSLGAYFAYVRHPFEGSTSVQIAERLAREAGVATVPGEYFGPGQERYLRVAFANANAESTALLTRRLRSLA